MRQHSHSYERAKLCVAFAVASELRGMDAAYERCVKKVVIAIFSKEEIKKYSVWPFLWLLSFGHSKESNTPTGRKTKLQLFIKLR